jgi:hypothetical protein
MPTSDLTPQQKRMAIIRAAVPVLLVIIIVAGGGDRPVGRLDHDGESSAAPPQNHRHSPPSAPHRGRHRRPPRPPTALATSAMSAARQLQAARACVGKLGDLQPRQPHDADLRPSRSLDGPQNPSCCNLRVPSCHLRQHPDPRGALSLTAARCSPATTTGTITVWPVGGGTGVTIPTGVALGSFARRQQGVRRDVSRPGSDRVGHSDWRRDVIQRQRCVQSRRQPDAQRSSSPATTGEWCARMSLRSPPGGIAQPG